MTLPSTTLELNRCIFGDALKVLRTLPDGVFDACISSPPYWRLRSYDCRGQYGLEATPEKYIRKQVAVFREIRRVLHKRGSLWLVIGDSAAASGCGGGGRFMKERGEGAWSMQAQLKGFCKASRGLKRKDMVGIPWMLAFALRADGWYLRQDIIWEKLNPQPESVKDRPSRAHEYVFLLSKSPGYYYNGAAIREATTGNAHPRGDGLNPKARANATGSRQNESFSGATSGYSQAADRNARSVWTFPSEPYSGAHFAPFPTALVKRCMLAGCPEGGVVIDPYIGSGTVGRVAEDLGRRWLGIELGKHYAPLIARRTAQKGMLFHEPPEPARHEPEQFDLEVGA